MEINRNLHQKVESNAARACMQADAIKGEVVNLKESLSKVSIELAQRGEEL